MPRFNKSKKKLVLPSVINYEGALAFPMSHKLELASILMTSFGKDQFYRQMEETVNRIGLLINEEPEFAAKAAVFARNEFGMRTITHIVAVFIAKFIKGKEWTRPFFYSVVRRPDDITEIMSLYLTSFGKPIPNSLKDGMALALTKFGTYQMAKYRAENKKVSLVDVVNLTHPRHLDSGFVRSPFDPQSTASLIKRRDNKKALELLVKDELRSTDTWESKLSSAGSDEELKKDAWVDLIQNNKLGYFALLRNLRNINNQSPQILDKALEQLVDKRRIKNSLVFPFRFFAAKKSVNDNPQIVAAIDDAVEISLSNIPKLPGKTLVAVDNSGSMQSSGDDNNNSPAEIANLFGAALYKSQNLGSVDVISFGSNANFVYLNPRDSLITMCEQLNHNTYTTNMYRVFNLIDESNKVYDRIVILSDMQAYGEHTAISAYKRYCKKLNTNPKLYSIDLTGYGTIQFPEKDIYSISGFSEKIFDIISLFEEDRNAFVNTIESTPLNYRFKKIKETYEEVN